MIDLVFYNLLGVICILYILFSVRYFIKNRNETNFLGNIALLIAGFVYFFMCAGAIYAIDNICNNALSWYMLTLDSIAARIYVIAITISLLIISTAEIAKRIFGASKKLILVIVYALVANSIIILQPIAYSWLKFFCMLL